MILDNLHYTSSTYRQKREAEEKNSTKKREKTGAKLKVKLRPKVKRKTFTLFTENFQTRQNEKRDL